MSAGFIESGYTAVKAVQLSPDPGYTNEQECITSEVNSDPPDVTVKLYAEENTGDLKIVKTSENDKNIHR